MTPKPHIDVEASLDSGRGQTFTVDPMLEHAEAIVGIYWTTEDGEDEPAIARYLAREFIPNAEHERLEHEAGAAIDDLTRQVATLQTEVERLREALDEAWLQLKYLDERFPTGTTPAVLVRIDRALAAYRSMMEASNGR